MDLYLLIERTTLDEDEWRLMGIFDSEEKALEKGEEYKIKVVRNHLICNGQYLEIRKMEGNKIDDIFYGYDGFFEEYSPKVIEIHYRED